MTVVPLPVGSSAEVVLAEVLREVWEKNRPGWVDPSWWSLPVREDVAGLLRLSSGPQLLAAVAVLDAGVCRAAHVGEGLPGDPVPGSVPGFPCGCQVVLVAAWAAVASWTSVQASAALTGAAGAEPVQVAGSGARPPIVDPAREEMAAAARLTQGSADAWLRRSRALAAFPRAAALAAEGLLPLRTVENACTEAAKLSPEDGQAVMDAWVTRVRERAAKGRPMTGQGAARAAGRLIVAAPSHQEARDRARKNRRVELWRFDDGTAAVHAVLPEEVALRVHRRLTAIANGLDDPSDNRPLDAKRADVLVDVLLGMALSQPSGVEVNVTISAASLLGRSEEPGEVAGLGPVPAEVARELAADGRWRAWLTDAEGSVAATSSTTYRPSTALARLVRARHPHCRMPGCTRPSQACDLDHATPWPRGRTTANNLGPLCRRHHVLKTHYGWELDPDSGTWRTPAGACVPAAA